MTKKIRTYSTEFKAEAVKKIADNDGDISATAKQLGIAMQTLSNWHNKATQGKLEGTEQYATAYGRDGREQAPQTTA